MVFISVLAIGAVNASDSDNITDTMELSVVDDEVETVDIDIDQSSQDVLCDGEANASDVQMSVIAEDTSYDENATVEVSVVDKNNSIDFNSCSVEISVGGKSLSTLPLDSTGKISYDIPFATLDVGEYYVEANLLDGTSKKIMTNYTMLNIAKATPIVTLENVTAIIGAGVKVPVNVTDRRGKAVSGDAMVTIFINGNSISKYARIVNGSAESSFDMSDMMGMMGGMMGGSGDMWSMFGGNGTGNGTSGNGTTMNFNMSDIASMMNGSGGMGPMGAMGSSAVKFTYFLPVGTYNITATFLPNRNYDEASNSTDLTVVYNTDVLFVADITAPEKIGDKTVVNIMALDKNGNLMPNIDVTAILDDSQEVNATLNEYASAQVTFDNVVSGAHKLLIATNATGNITNQTVEFTVSLPRVDVKMTIKSMSVVTVNTAVDGKIGKYFSVTLKDELGNVLSGKKVQISINNKKYTVTTNKNGVAKLQLNIAKYGVYTCAAAFLGDDTYNGAFDIAKVTVKKQTAKLTTAKKTYKAKAKTKKLTATFKSAKGKAIKGKKITFKVKGKTYTAKTNAKGVATVKVKLTKKGKYTFTAKFAGDNTYKAISKKAKLILK